MITSSGRTQAKDCRSARQKLLQGILPVQSGSHPGLDAASVRIRDGPAATANGQLRVCGKCGRNRPIPRKEPSPDAVTARQSNLGRQAATPGARAARRASHHRAPQGSVGHFGKAAAVADRAPPHPAKAAKEPLRDNKNTGIICPPGGSPYPGAVGKRRRRSGVCRHAQCRHRAPSSCEVSAGHIQI